MNEAAVDAWDLILGYNSDVVFDRSSFTIPRGQLTAVIGPNGSGKSTLLNAIAGLMDPLAGSIEVPAGARRIAYVLQTNRVNEALPITVREVVTMGRYAGVGGYRRWRRRWSEPALQTSRRAISTISQPVRVSGSSSLRDWRKITSCCFWTNR